MENIARLGVSEQPNRLGRSTGAVLAGFVTVLVTHTGTDAVLHATGVFPQGANMSAALFALALAYRSVFTVLGGYVTASLAPRRPIKHALVLGGIGTVPCLGGVAAAVIQAPDLGPLWYPVLLLLLTLPCCWLGGRLRQRQI